VASYTQYPFIVCMPVTLIILNQLKDLHETSHEHHAIRCDSVRLIHNLIPIGTR
jgi:hypothetical protein